MKDATAQNVANFLENEVFHAFGVPEIAHSDNGKQFVSKSCEEMVKKNYKIKPFHTVYVEKYDRDWDLYLAEIEQSLRTSVHSATWVNPFFALFGFNMFTSGSDYQLAKKLLSLTDHQIDPLNRSDKLEIMREKVKENMHRAYQTSAKRYNERARVVKFRPGQDIEETMLCPISKTTSTQNSLKNSSNVGS